MDAQKLELLLSDPGQQLLSTLTGSWQPGHTLQLVAKLRAEGHSAELVSAVLNQIELREKAKLKFGDLAKNMLFSQAGLEQATRLPIAERHAARFKAAGITKLADLGAGIGADSIAFAEAGLEVAAVEKDEITAQILQHNLTSYPDAKTYNQSAESYVSDQQGETSNSISAANLNEATDSDKPSTWQNNTGFWLDPARRDSGNGRNKKLSNPADWSPSLDWVFDFVKDKNAGVKLSPAMDHCLIPKSCEAEWVSHAGQVVELTVWFGRLATPGITRRATVISAKNNSLNVATLSAPAAQTEVAIGELGQYLYDPDGAVIRAQLLGLLGAELAANAISDKIAYLSSDSYSATPFASGFRIIAELSASPDKLKRELKQRGIGILEIKKRGWDGDPALLRKQLRLSGPNQATLFLTRISGQHRAILAERMQ